MSNPASDGQNQFRIAPAQHEVIDLGALAKALILVAKDIAASSAYKRSKARKAKKSATPDSNITTSIKKGEKS